MRPAAAVLVVLAACGCETHPGRVLVVVDSDYAVPAVLSEVRILAGPADDPEDRTGQAFVLTRVTPAPTGTHSLPLSLVVTPREGDSTRRVEIVAEGRSAASGEVLIRSTRILNGFRASNTIVLPIFLGRNCQGTTCDAGRTCIDGTCETVEIDPGVLRIAEEPGEEFRELADSSIAPDARLDAGVDAMDGGSFDGSLDGSPVDSSPPLDGMLDTAVDSGICGPPITLSYLVTVGPSTLYPLDPAPGVWAYNEPNVRLFDTFVEWTYTARPGCEVWRIEPAIPEGRPLDPLVACSGSCATRVTWGANYEIYRDGSTDYDEIIVADQSIAVGSVRLNISNPATTITVMLSDWTSDVGVRRDEVYVVFHTATFYSRPI